MMDLIRFSLIISFLLSVNCIKVKRLIATSLLSTTAFLQSPITSSYASTLDEYLVREIDFNANDRFKKPVKLQLIQGFASLRGKVPAKDGGDRTGTYTWPGIIIIIIHYYYFYYYYYYRLLSLLSLSLV